MGIKFKDLPVNLLPYNGEVILIGQIFTSNEANEYFIYLNDNIPWKSEQIKMYGKLITTKRKSAWFGDNGISYKYSGNTFHAFPWTNELLQLKKIVEEFSGNTYNSCLLNLYPNGETAMAWHADDEPELKPDGTIASLSFGAERRIVFKHKTTKEKVETTLEHGSLLLMKGETQKFWLHQLPVAKKVKTERINLTFRTII